MKKKLWDKDRSVLFNLFVWFMITLSTIICIAIFLGFTYFLYWLGTHFGWWVPFLLK